MSTFRNIQSVPFSLGGVSKKNDRDEIFGAFIREKVWLKNSLSQSEGGMTERGRVRVENKAKV